MDYTYRANENNGCHECKKSFKLQPFKAFGKYFIFVSSTSGLNARSSYCSRVRHFSISLFAVSNNKNIWHISNEGFQRFHCNSFISNSNTCTRSFKWITECIRTHFFSTSTLMVVCNGSLLSHSTSSAYYKYKPFIWTTKRQCNISTRRLHFIFMNAFSRKKGNFFNFKLKLFNWSDYSSCSLYCLFKWCHTVTRKCTRIIESKTNKPVGRL